MLLKLIKTNNYFGQHDFILENVTDLESVLNELAEIKWHKKPTIIPNVDTIQIHCFTNYDKVKVEGKYSNG